MRPEFSRVIGLSGKITHASQPSRPLRGAIRNCTRQLDLLGVVVGVLDSAFDVLLVKYGIIKRVYTNRLKLARDPRYVDSMPPALILHWDSSIGVADEVKQADVGPMAREHQIGTNAVMEQTLRILSIVRVVLSPAADPPKYNAIVLPSPDKKPLTFKDMAAYISCDDGLSGKFT